MATTKAQVVIFYRPIYMHEIQGRSWIFFIGFQIYFKLKFPTWMRILNTEEVVDSIEAIRLCLCQEH
jgi:hypothetical protein